MTRSCSDGFKMCVELLDCYKIKGIRCKLSLVANFVCYEKSENCLKISLEHLILHLGEIF